MFKENEFRAMSLLCTEKSRQTEILQEKKSIRLLTSLELTIPKPFFLLSDLRKHKKRREEAEGDDNRNAFWNKALPG